MTSQMTGITTMIPISLFRLMTTNHQPNTPFQQSISPCWWWLLRLVRLVLTPSVSATSTLPLASSSICLWILRIASKLRMAFSSLHSGSSMRQKSGGDKESHQDSVKRELWNSRVTADLSNYIYISATSATTTTTTATLENTKNLNCCSQEGNPSNGLSCCYVIRQKSVVRWRSHFSI